MKELIDFVKISKYAGERFDLIQAGGGNSSVKLSNGTMLIKASGFLLSDVGNDHGYSTVYYKKISEIVNSKSILNEPNKRKREGIATSLVHDYTVDKNIRPSIETLLHSFLLKYTLHTHPVAVNMILIRKNCKEIIESIFSNDRIAFVKYETPGVDLAIELKKVLRDLKEIPHIIFLQNHGLIINSDNVEDIYKLNEYVLSKIEKYLKIDLNKYKLTNAISNYLGSHEGHNKISYLSDDIFLNNKLRENKSLFLNTPFCPDGVVFCGIHPLFIEELSNKNSLIEYKQKYNDLPKVIIYRNNIFFIGNNIKKAKEMEEVMKFQILVLSHNLKSKKNFLKKEELAYLCNWEAEKFRQNI